MKTPEDRIAAVAGKGQQPMTDMDRRVQAATRALITMVGDNRDRSLQAEAIIRQSFPELFEGEGLMGTSHPTMWLAPWEATAEMIANGADSTDTLTQYDVRRLWNEMRDTHLARG